MSKIKAFICGVKEYKLSVTTHYGEDLIEWYDKGRQLACLLFRKERNRLG